MEKHNNKRGNTHNSEHTLRPLPINIHHKNKVKSTKKGRKPMTKYKKCDSTQQSDLNYELEHTAPSNTSTINNENKCELTKK